MRPAGLLQIEAARADGRWSAAYAPQSTATVPDDLRTALEADPAAAAAFAALPRSRAYALLLSLEKAVRPETRTRRLTAALTTLRTPNP